MAWNTLPRDYSALGTIAPDQTLELLIDRLQDYDATVYRAEQDEVPAMIQTVLAGMAPQPVLVPAGLPPHLLPSTARFVTDAGFAPHELDRFPIVLTTATLAIAETGTIVLQNVPGQGRRAASLVPDVHICVLNAGSVVHTVPEAMRLLQHTATLPTTFISGHQPLPISR